MAMESEGQRKEHSVLIARSVETEDEFDAPMIYAPLAEPWYKDLQSIVMFAYLSAVLLGGCIFLTALVFTQNPLEIFFITAGFVALTVIGIFLKIRLAKYS